MEDIESLIGRYNIHWIGRCQYDTSDKIWGFFFYIDPTSESRDLDYYNAYVFWARTGKTLSFKKHSYNRYRMHKQIEVKKDRKYKEMPKDAITSIWPTFYHDLNNQFVFHLLADDI